MSELELIASMLMALLAYGVLIVVCTVVMAKLIVKLVEWMER